MSESSKKYRLDRTAFKAMSFEEADHASRYYKDKTWQERLEIALYLTSIAYRFDMDHPPRMDKNLFTIQKR